MKILYAEDEKALSNAVTEILKMKQYEVDAVYDGRDAWGHLLETEYDAIILDIMMPGMDGLQILEKLRAQEIYTPVLLLTAKSTTEDRIEGLGIGADDYLAKPFDMGELLARLEALLRRTTAYRVKQVKCGNVVLNCDTNEVKAETGSLRLSSKETELLKLFMKNAGIAFTGEALEKKLWPGESSGSTVTLYISYLKTKLKQLHADIYIEQIDNSYILKF